MTIDDRGNVHDGLGRFDGHIQHEGDAETLLPAGERPEYGEPGYFEYAQAFSDQLAAAVGGEVTQTGGGCTAVQVMLPAGGELLVTNGDASMPDGGDAVISVDDLNDGDEQQVYEIMGPLTPDQLAAEVRRAVQVWNMRHGHCDRDQLAAYLGAADPHGLLSAEQREAVLGLSDIFDGQPAVDIERSCGAYVSVRLDTDSDQANELPGRITGAFAEFATKEAPGPRELRFDTRWTLPGTDWISGSTMTVTPDQSDPAHVRAMVKRLASIQTRVDEQVNRPGATKHKGNYSAFTHAFVNHNYGRTELRVTPSGGHSDGTFVVEGDRFSAAIVNTGFGSIRVTGDDLRQVTAGLAHQMWLDRDYASRPAGPDTPETIE